MRESVSENVFPNRGVFHANGFVSICSCHLRCAQKRFLSVKEDITVDEMRVPTSQTVQTDIPNLVDVEQVDRKRQIVASSDINSTRPNRIPVPRQDRRLCAQQVFAKWLAGVQASWLAFPVDVNPSRMIRWDDIHSSERFVVILF